MSKTFALRHHDFSMGHKVTGHENKCAHLHGHNYRVHWKVTTDTYNENYTTKLDDIGRVVDFSVIKSRLSMWLEDNWDHKFLIYEKDPKADALEELFPDSLVKVPFNPTAENMAEYLVEKVAPGQLKDLGVVLVECRIDETRKCSAIYTK